MPDHKHLLSWNENEPVFTDRFQFSLSNLLPKIHHRTNSLAVWHIGGKGGVGLSGLGYSQVIPGNPMRFGYHAANDGVYIVSAAKTLHNAVHHVVKGIAATNPVKDAHDHIQVKQTVEEFCDAEKLSMVSMQKAASFVTSRLDSADRAELPPGFEAFRTIYAIIKKQHFQFG